VPLRHDEDGVVVDQAPAPADARAEPSAVHLRPMGLGGSRSCLTCDHRADDANCTKVLGAIALDQLCNLYKAIPHVVVAPAPTPTVEMPDIPAELERGNPAFTFGRDP
jgi:hypothetical protein